VGVLSTYVAMTLSSLFGRSGDDGLRVVTALMAIIVWAIAVQSIIDGATGAVRQIMSSP
jgi:small neutral amino acid transporter SnatA (MarC family)